MDDYIITEYGIHLSILEGKGAEIDSETQGSGVALRLQTLWKEP